jgi:hypothetical protein
LFIEELCNHILLKLYFLCVAIIFWSEDHIIQFVLLFYFHNDFLMKIISIYLLTGYVTMLTYLV